MTENQRELQREGTYMVLLVIAFAAGIYLSLMTVDELEKQKAMALKRVSLNPEDFAKFDTGGAELQQDFEEDPPLKPTPTPTLNPQTLATPRVEVTAVPSPTPVSRVAIDVTPGNVPQTGAGYVLAAGSVSTMQTPRVGHTANRVQGLVVISGGIGPSGVLDSVEIIDFSENNSLSLEASVLPRVWGSSVSSNQGVFLLGGEFNTPLNSQSFVLRSEVEFFDITSLQTSVLTVHPDPRVRASAVLIGDKIYYVGGSKNNIPVNTLNIYDITSNSWSTGTPMPNAREAPAVVKNGKIYIAGGSIGAYGTVSCHIYDPFTDTWTTCSSLPFPRSQHTALILGDRVVLLGDSSFTPLGMFYDIPTDTWIERRVWSGEILPRNSAAVVFSKSVYLFGGSFSEQLIPFAGILAINLGD